MDVPVPRIVEASRPIAADAAVSRVHRRPGPTAVWDGNDNWPRRHPGSGSALWATCSVMTLTLGAVRHNHVVEFEEGRLIAWRPAEPGGEPPGHLWRWTLQPVSEKLTLVTHTYDWTQLTDPTGLHRAWATTADRLGVGWSGWPRWSSMQPMADLHRALHEYTPRRSAEGCARADRARRQRAAMPQALRVCSLLLSPPRTPSSTAWAC